MSTEIVQSDEVKKAAEEVVELTKTPTNDDKLKLYSLYKQGALGDNTTEKPGMLDFVGKAKWNAWEEQKGKTPEDAQQEYIDFVKELQAKDNDEE